jgi:hypothetical protein
MKNTTYILHSYFDGHRMMWPNGIKFSDTSLPITHHQRTGDGSFYKDLFINHTGMPITHVGDIRDIPQECRYLYPIYVESSNFWNDKKFLMEPLDIPTTVITDILNDKARLIFSMVKEGQGFFMDSRVQIIKRQTALLGLKPKHVYFMDGNYRNVEFCTIDNNAGIKALTYNYWEKSINPMAAETADSVIASIKSTNLRNYKFICLNRVARDHRILIVKRLEEHGIDKNTILSLGPQIEMSPFGVNREDVHQEIIQYFSNPSVLRNVDTPLSAPLWHSIGQIVYELQLDAYLNICTETFFDKNTSRLFSSEKIWKSIVSMQPMILVAEHGALQILKQKGFKTFSPWINESYDLEVNDYVRFNLIVEEIVRLNKLTHTELSNMLLEMLPVLLHNAKVYADLFSTKKSEEAILNEIHNTWNKDPV